MNNDNVLRTTGFNSICIHISEILVSNEPVLVSYLSYRYHNYSESMGIHACYLYTSHVSLLTIT